MNETQTTSQPSPAPLAPEKIDWTPQLFMAAVLIAALLLIIGFGGAFSQ